MTDPLEDSELVKIAKLFSPDKFSIFAVEHMKIANEQLGIIWSDVHNRGQGNTRFMTEVLITWRNKNNPNQREVFQK